MLCCFTGNVALNKPGSLTPNSKKDGHSALNDPKFAVDGITSRLSGDFPCTFIRIEGTPCWWRLHLQQVYTIYGVTFITCTDHCRKLTFCQHVN